MAFIYFYCCFFVDVVGCVLFLENTMALTRSRPSAIPAITYNTVADIDPSALCAIQNHYEGLCGSVCSGLPKTVAVLTESVCLPVSISI